MHDFLFLSTSTPARPFFVSSTFGLWQFAIFGPRHVAREVGLDVLPGRLEVARPLRRPLAPRPEETLFRLLARALAGEARGLLVLVAHHVVVAKVGSVVFEATARVAEAVGAFHFLWNDGS